MQPAHRDRPLQNSMFLPDTNNNRRGSIEYPNSNLGVMKKQIDNSYQTNQRQHLQQHFNQFTSNMQNTQTGVGSMGNRTFSFEDQQIKQSSGSKKLQQALSQFNERLQRIGRVVDKHQNQLSMFNIQSKKQQLSRQVLNQIKQNLPVITGTNDVYDHIFGLKLEIKNVKEEITKLPKKSDLQMITKSLDNSLKKNQAENSNSKSDISLSSTSINDQQIGEFIKQRDEHFKNILGGFERQMSLIKKSLQNHSLEMKVSPISSSSCIVLKYQQLFKARSRNQTDIIINQHTYYIDNEGHLLDCNSRYLIDQKGKKVKLEDKHISILKNQKILQQ